MEITGEALGMARIGLNMDRGELADLLGVSLRTVANWEKNGVPAHRTALVMTKMGASISAAQESLEFTQWQKTPAGLRQLEQDYERLVANGDLEPATRRPGLGFRRPVHELLSPYSTAVLLQEVARRVRRLEEEMEGLDVYADSVSSETNADPDYSQMSDEDAKDYGLAANLGDPNIEHDELPHEP